MFWRRKISTFSAQLSEASRARGTSSLSDERKQGRRERMMKWIMRSTHLIPFDEFLSFLKSFRDFHGASAHSDGRSRWRVARTLLVGLGSVVGQSGWQGSRRWCCKCRGRHFSSFRFIEFYAKWILLFRRLLHRENVFLLVTKISTNCTFTSSACRSWTLFINFASMFCQLHS